MSTAKELIKKGRQEGIQEGRQKERQLIINNMLKKGYTLDEIQKITGVTKIQIKELQEKTEQKTEQDKKQERTSISYGEVALLYLAIANDDFDFDKAVEIDSKLKTGMGDTIMSIAKELIEKGRQEGIQEGRQKERQLIINNMLKKGYTLDEIQKATGLTEAQIKELQEKKQ